jgi:cardiolipin synthase
VQGVKTPKRPDAANPAVSNEVDRVVTVPNLITLIRLACLPLFVWLLLGQDNPLAAGALLGALGATDWVDGWYARRFNQVSSFGKIFDPVVDRLLFFVSIVAIIAADAAPLWFCVAVLLREGVISVATLVLASLGARRIDVTWMGKAATFGLMFAFPAFLWAAAEWPLQGLFSVLAWVCAIPSLLASYYAAATYVPLGLQALRDGRASRSESL